jgi:hypothetical protein
VSLTQYQGEGEPILTWMHENELYSAVERGTITC